MATRPRPSAHWSSHGGAAGIQRAHSLDATLMKPAFAASTRRPEPCGGALGLRAGIARSHRARALPASRRLSCPPGSGPTLDPAPPDPAGMPPLCSPRTAQPHRDGTILAPPARRSSPGTGTSRLLQYGLAVEDPARAEHRGIVRPRLRLESVERGRRRFMALLVDEARNLINPCCDVVRPLGDAEDVFEQAIRVSAFHERVGVHEQVLLEDPHLFSAYAREHLGGNGSS